MSIIKTYSTHPRITSDFGSSELEAQQNKVKKIAELTNNGHMIVSGYDTPYNDKTLTLLKSASTIYPETYKDIYGNQTKYWEAIFS